MTEVNHGMYFTIKKIMPLIMFAQGMYINHDDLVTLATGPPGQGEAILQGLDRSR